MLLLMRLMETQFEEVLFRAHIPPQYIAGVQAPLAQRALTTVLLVDTGEPAMRDALVAAIRRVAPGVLR